MRTCCAPQKCRTGCAPQKCRPGTSELCSAVISSRHFWAPPCPPRASDLGSRKPNTSGRLEAVSFPTPDNQNSAAGVEWQLDYLDHNADAAPATRVTVLEPWGHDVGYVLGDGRVVSCRARVIPTSLRWGRSSSMPATDIWSRSAGRRPPCHAGLRTRRPRMVAAGSGGSRRSRGSPSSRDRPSEWSFGHVGDSGVVDRGPLLQRPAAALRQLGGAGGDSVSVALTDSSGNWRLSAAWICPGRAGSLLSVHLIRPSGSRSPRRVRLSVCSSIPRRRWR